ncbi:MAG: hypothetical protein H8E24_14760 [Verrucomicrobia bacterium]|nr:hypothetical protein [Verrucomicrobiota bacterium]
MDILVFLSKKVGLECAMYLLDAFPKDKYRFIFTGEDFGEARDALGSRAHKVEVLSDQTLRDIEGENSRKYDWLLNLWGSHIFKTEQIKRAKRTLNIHPSMLPLGRGRDPVVWSIINGWPAGVTLHEIDDGIDTGAIWHQEEEPYEFPIMGGELYQRVLNRSVKVFCQQWPQLRRGGDVPIAQQPGTIATRRCELMEGRSIRMDDDNSVSGFVRKLCAYDFPGDFSAQLMINGRSYSVRLALELLEPGEEGNRSREL